jgi:hypothetical protein
MTPDEYAMKLGYLVGNLSGLESVLRAVIHTLGEPAATSSNIGNLKLTVGMRVRSDALSDYDSLGKIIDRYNGLAAADRQVAKSDIVDLRDAIAHGRIVAAEVGEPYTLLKFSRLDKEGFVTVERCEVMDADWLDQRIAAVGAAIIVAASYIGGHA